MTKIFFYAAILISIIIFNKCTAYTPSVTNVPLHEKEGEVKINLHASSSGINPQFSATVSNNLAIMINGNIGNNYGYGNHFYVEGALGYFTKFSEKIIFENFFGGGKGSSYYKHKGYFSTETMDSYINKLFLQPEIGFKGRRTHLIIAPKFSYVNIQGININYGDKTQLNYNVIYSEPSITLKYGSEKFKIMSQFGLYIPLTESNYIVYSNLVFSIGFQYNFLD
jgi:hypothetical protein